MLVGLQRRCRAATATCWSSWARRCWSASRTRCVSSSWRPRCWSR
jgi:hypothetical protein